MNILGIIPARGGSSGIPRKNLALLADKPLIAYAIEASQGANRLNRTVVSTDNIEIAEVARSLGADVPFIRPASLATDTAKTIDVVQHVLKTLQPEAYDAVVLIQPTAPLRLAGDIDNAVSALTDEFDSVVSLAEVPHQFNPHWLHSIKNGRMFNFVIDGPLTYTRRQDLPSAFYRNGAAYVTRTAVINQYNNLYGARVAPYVMPLERSVNIDHPIDLYLAEYYLRQRLES